MMERSQRIKRIKAQNKLLYRRTQIDNPEESGGKGLYILIFCLIIAFSYLVFFSGIFTIQNIMVSGNTIQDEGAVRARVEAALDQQFFKRNLLFFDKKIVSYNVTKDFVFKKVELEKKYPSGLAVKVEEYVPQIQWKTNNDYYFLDERGKATVKTSNVKEDLPLVIDKKNLEIEIGKSIVSPDFIKFIKYLADNFQSDTGKKIGNIEINENINEIIIYSDFPYLIYFDTSRDPETELLNLLTVMETLKGKSLSYIDLRIENKVFYK